VCCWADVVPSPICCVSAWPPYVTVAVWVTAALVEDDTATTSMRFVPAFTV
jgi:hypothetical protein